MDHQLPEPLLAFVDVGGCIGHRLLTIEAPDRAAGHKRRGAS